jgi:hypothetical protein
MDPDRARFLTPAVATVSVMIGAVMLLTRRERRRRSTRARPWIRRREGGRGLLHMVHNELAVEDHDAFRNFMRMSENQLKEILGMVTDDIARQDDAKVKNTEKSLNYAHTILFHECKQTSTAWFRFLPLGAFATQAQLV